MNRAELRALVERATPEDFAPLTHDERYPNLVSCKDGFQRAECYGSPSEDEGDQQRKDAAFARLIVAAVNALPALLDELDKAEARIAELAGALEGAGRLTRAARGLQRHGRIGECRPNCDECDAARLEFSAALRAVEPIDVAEVIESAVPGEHVCSMHGNPDRRGVAGRWSWSCRCGAASTLADMTLSEAGADSDRHRRAAAAIGGGT